MFRIKIEKCPVVVKRESELTASGSEFLPEQKIERYRSAQLVSMGHCRDHDMRPRPPAVECRDIVETGVSGTVGRDIRRNQFNRVAVGQGGSSVKRRGVRTDLRSGRLHSQIYCARQGSSEDPASS